MNERALLKTLIYCFKCYKPDKEIQIRYYIGECMHIVCQHCFIENNRCVVCQTKNAFRILDKEFTDVLLRNPAEIFNEPIESTMFQVSSALNLIEKQKAEIYKLHKLLKRAKEELKRLKDVKRPEIMTKGKLFNFHKDEQKEEIKDTIDKIYYKDKQKINEKEFYANKKYNSVNKENIFEDSLFCARNSVRDTKNSYLIDLTNKKKKLFTNYNPSEISMSTSKSNRLTIPNKESEFKYVFRKQSRF